MPDISMGTAMADAAPLASYQGADAILRQAAEIHNQTKPKDEKLSPVAQLRADLKSFQSPSATLTSAEVAAVALW